MTTLVSWIAYDQRAPAAAYIATDSRISGKGQSCAWDGVRKCFASRRHADIFGYYGNVQFPSLVLGQLVDALDSGYLVAADASLEERQEAVTTGFKQALEAYPTEWNLDHFTVLHVGRIAEGMDLRFQAMILECKDRALGLSRKTSLTGGEMLTLGLDAARELELANPNQIETSTSQLQVDPGNGGTASLGSVTARGLDSPIAEGAGKGDFEQQYRMWSQSDAKHTSRAVFSALCDSIAGGAEASVGGPPQLVALYRKWSGRALGVVHDGVPSVLGRALNASYHQMGEFRNGLFERVDQYGNLLPGAKKHSTNRVLRI